MQALSIRRAAQTTRGFILALAAAAVLVGPAASVSAQTTTVDGYSVYHTQYGRTHHRSLNGADIRLQDGSRGELFQFDGRRGDCALVTMTSSNIDSYLVLRSDRPFGPQISVDDDSGPALNSRIRVRLPRTGVYYITATSYGAGADYGQYSLMLDRC